MPLTLKRWDELQVGRASAVDDNGGGLPPVRGIARNCRTRGLLRDKQLSAVRNPIRHPWSAQRTYPNERAILHSISGANERIY
jgi:hypothetical protein